MSDQKESEEIVQERISGMFLTHLERENHHDDTREQRNGKFFENSLHNNDCEKG